MAIRDWFRIDWRSWRFWLMLIFVLDTTASFIFGGASSLRLIIEMIFLAFSLGLRTTLGFVPKFMWWILGIFILIKWRRRFGIIFGGIGKFIGTKGWISWLVSLPFTLIGKILGYKAGQTKWTELRKRYKGIRWAYGVNLFADLTKKVFTEIPGLRTHFMRLRNIKGREPEIVFRNRLLFMRLLDQNLRFDIFYRKSMYMKDNESLLKRLTVETEKYKDQASLKKMILLLKSRSGKINVGKKEEPDYIGEDPEPSGLEPSVDEYVGQIGWNYTNRISVLYMNRLMEWFRNKISEFRIASGENRARLNEILKSEAETREFHNISNIIGGFNTGKKYYDERLGNYKHHHEIKAYTLNMWDMFNVSWKGYHPYRFAKRGAEYIDTSGATAVVNNNKTEVNVHGEFAVDVRNDAWPRRRLKNPRRDSLPFPPDEDMGKIAEKYVRDWTGFIRDFREGFHHPHSRNVQEYMEAWNKGIWRDDDMPEQPKGGRASFAFDLRALADPGIYTWWGRENYDDPTEKVRTGNPEPHISQYGIRIFIKRLIERTSAHAKETQEFLSNYPFDRKEIPKTLKDLDRNPVIGPYEDKKGE